MAILDLRNVDTKQAAPFLDVTLRQFLCFTDGAVAVADEHRVSIQQERRNRPVQENKLAQEVPAVFVCASLSWIRNDRFSDVITILSSRASQPTPQSKMGVLPFTSFFEGVPDNSSGGSNFFLHHHSPCRRKHECLVSQVAATADGSQARAALARTGTFLLISAALSSVISSMPSLSIAFTLSGSIWQGRSNTRKIWFERRSEKMVSPSFCSDASCRLPVMHTERGATC